mgnify:CR=1 FL=1
MIRAIYQFVSDYVIHCVIQGFWTSTRSNWKSVFCNKLAKYTSIRKPLYFQYYNAFWLFYDSWYYRIQLTILNITGYAPISHKHTQIFCIRFGNKLRNVRQTDGISNISSDSRSKLDEESEKHTHFLYRAT